MDQAPRPGRNPFRALRGLFKWFDRARRALSEDPDRARRVLLQVLWVAALLNVVLYAGDVVGTTAGAIGRRLSRTWALVAAVLITVLTSPLVRRRWSQLSRRVQIGLVLLAVLYGLAASAAPLQALLVLVLAAIVGLLAAWVLVVPRRLAPSLPTETLDALAERDRVELTDGRLRLQNDLRTTALQAVGGLAILAGAILAFQQLSADRQQATITQELTRQGQASERFTRAIDQLGSDRTEMQLGGIYGLEQIMQQAPDNRLAVIQVLVAYLHRRSPRPANPTTQPPEKLGVRAPDVQAALTVLMHRPGAEIAQLVATSAGVDPPLDLSGLDLSGADISGEIFLRPENRYAYRAGRLSWADLRGTDLRGATFSGVDLSHADLRGADLRGADLYGLEDYLSDEDASRVDFSTANLGGALADRSTQWPREEIDWRASGVKMMQP